MRPRCIVVMRQVDGSGQFIMIAMAVEVICIGGMDG